MILVVPLGKGPYFRATRLGRCTLFFCPNLLSLEGREGFSGEHFCPAWLRASYPPPNPTTSFRNHASLESLQCRHCRVQQAAPKHFQETLSLPEKRTRQQRTLQTGILLVIDIVPVCVCVPPKILLASYATNLTSPGRFPASQLCSFSFFRQLFLAPKG